MERESQQRTLEQYELHKTDNPDTPLGGWWKISSERLYTHISVALEQHKVAEGASADVVKFVTKSNAGFCEAFRKESAQVLQWALLLFILNRCPQLCHTLIDQGLTETLLMRLLDIAHPVQQAAALSELHRLRLMSPLPQEIVANVLWQEDMVR